ncbi:MAG: CoA-binding protein [Bacteroidales bacterium]|nr:CoA-binding protein [Bacteroidales bacterium]
MKPTIVLGASPNPSRYSYKAVKLLSSYGHRTIPLGIRKGEINGLEILTDWNINEEVHTITMYIRADSQVQYYDFIFSLNPKRIIFNPGTENDELAILANEKNIKVIKNCTLVMLNQAIY